MTINRTERKKQHRKTPKKNLIFIFFYKIGGMKQANELRKIIIINK